MHLGKMCCMLVLQWNVNGHNEIVQNDQIPQDSFGEMCWVIVVNGEGHGMDKKDVYTSEPNGLIPVQKNGKAPSYKFEKKEKTGAYKFTRGINLKAGDTKASVSKLLVEMKEAAAVKNGKFYIG